MRKHQGTFTLGLASLKPLGNPTQPCGHFPQALPLSLSLPVPDSLYLLPASSANRSVLFLGTSRISLYDIWSPDLEKDQLPYRFRSFRTGFPKWFILGPWFEVICIREEYPENWEKDKTS